MENLGRVAIGEALSDWLVDAMKLNIPVEDGVFRCSLCTEEYDREHRLSCHARERHDTHLAFVCSKCGRVDREYRPATIHHGKCTGPAPKEDGALLPFPCTVCGSSFVSKRAMTQHKRHRHITVRNEERLESLSRSGQPPRNRVWSPDQERTFMEVGGGLVKWTPAAQRALMKAFPGKSKTQIYNKWKALRRRERKPPRARPEPVPRETEAERPRESIQPTTSCECGHGESLEPEVNWNYVVKTTKAVINRIKQNGPRASDRKVPRKAHHRQRRCKAPTRQRKKRRYAEVQRLWDLAPGKLAETILDGDAAQCSPCLKTATRHFKTLFETPNEFCGQLEYAGNGSCDPCKMITPKEVKRAVANSRFRGACGPDGLRPLHLKRSLKGGAQCQIAKVFNLWLRFRRVPHFQCEHRTVLIPKAGAKPTDMSTWRPITVGNVLLRTFCSVIARRLSRSMPINEIQRGFVACDGIAENSFLFARILKEGNTSSRDTAIVLIDFARAFDSVGHAHLFAALKRLGICEGYQRVFEHLYSVSTTRIQVGNEFSEPIRFARGVMQGNPASTELFKAALDPLISELQRSGNGIVLRGASQRLGCLGFADDMVVVAESVEGMAKQLVIVSDFCREFGLQLNVRKCKSVLLRRTRDHTIVDTAAKWLVGEEQIPQVGPEEPMKYLGIEFYPLKGPRVIGTERRLRQWIERIGAQGTGLKPDQRMSLLCTYAVPRLLHQLKFCPVSGTELSTLDRLIRRAVKKWVKLPPSATNGVLYATNRDGGLAIPKLGEVLPRAKAKTQRKLACSDFSVVAEVYHALTEEEQNSVWGKVQRMEGKKPWRKEEVMAWELLQVQGIGIRYFLESSVSNSWLRRPQGFKASTWCRCLQVRTATYPTRTALLVGGREGLRECRLCGREDETLPHLLSACPMLRSFYVKRHDRIVNLLAAQCASAGWRVRKEFGCRTEEGRVLRPDLILHAGGGRAIVIDVAIVYESKRLDINVFEKRYWDKVKKYETLSSYIAKEGLGETTTVHGFILGARGAYPKINDQVLADIGIRNWHFQAMLSRRALLMSVDMLKQLEDDTPGKWVRFEEMEY